jgi:hypothetical protein
MTGVRGTLRQAQDRLWDGVWEEYNPKFKTACPRLHRGQILIAFKTQSYMALVANERLHEIKSQISSFKIQENSMFCVPCSVFDI